jgi:hypothetical protein
MKEKELILKCINNFFQLVNKLKPLKSPYNDLIKPRMLLKNIENESRDVELYKISATARATGLMLDRLIKENLELRPSAIAYLFFSASVMEQMLAQSCAESEFYNQNIEAVRAIIDYTDELSSSHMR